MLAGCGDNSIDPPPLEMPARAVTEAQMEADPSITIEMNRISVVQLEDTGSPANLLLADVSGIGVDRIGLTSAEDGSIAITIPGDAQFTMKIFPSGSSTPLAELSAASPSYSGTPGSSEYEVELTSLREYSAENKGFQLLYFLPGGSSSLTVSVDAAPGADFSDSDLSGMHFTGSDFTGSQFQRCTILGSTFDDCLLTEASFMESDLTSSGFRDAILTDSDLRFTTMQDTRMIRADLRGSLILEAKLDYSFFSFSDVRGVDFCGSSFYGWVVAGIVTDGTTKCYPGG